MFCKTDSTVILVISTIISIYMLASNGYCGSPTGTDPTARVMGAKLYHSKGKGARLLSILRTDTPMASVAEARVLKGDDLSLAMKVSKMFKKGNLNEKDIGEVAFLVTDSPLTLDSGGVEQSEDGAKGEGGKLLGVVYAGDGVAYPKSIWRGDIAQLDATKVIFVLARSRGLYLTIEVFVFDLSGGLGSIDLSEGLGSIPDTFDANNIKAWPKGTLPTTRLKTRFGFDNEHHGFAIARVKAIIDGNNHLLICAEDQNNDGAPVYFRCNLKSHEWTQVSLQTVKTYETDRDTDNGNKSEGAVQSPQAQE